MEMKSLASLKTNIEKVDLFEIPPSKTILWNHKSIGKSSKLHFAFHHKPIVNIKERALQDAVRYVESTPGGAAICYFSGSLKCGEDSSGSGVTLCLKKFEENVEFPLFDVAYAPVILSKKHKQSNWESKCYLKDLEALKENCGDVPEVLPKNFFQWRLSCSYMGINCDVKIELISVALTFVITPLNNLPVLASELTDYLSSNKDALHTGLVTMTKEKQFLLVPEDHLDLPSLPLVGIWVNGVSSIYHPLVWSACVHYISSTLYTKRVCLPPIPFLLILYQKDEKFPDFYDCIWNNGNIFPKYVLYEGMASTSLPKVPIYDSRSLCVELEKATQEKSAEFFNAVKQVKTTEISASYFNIVMSADDVSPKVQPEPIPDIPNLNNIMEKDDYSMLVKTDSDIFNKPTPQDVFHQYAPFTHVPRASSSDDYITHNSRGVFDHAQSIPKVSDLYSHYRNFSPHQLHEPNVPSPNCYNNPISHVNPVKPNVFFPPSPTFENVFQQQRSATQTANYYPSYANYVENHMVRERPVTQRINHFPHVNHLSTEQQFSNMRSPSEYRGVQSHTQYPQVNHDGSFPARQYEHGLFRTHHIETPNAQHNTHFEFPPRHPMLPNQFINAPRCDEGTYVKQGAISDYKDFYEDVKKYYTPASLNTPYINDNEDVLKKNFQTYAPSEDNQYRQQQHFRNQTSVPLKSNLHHTQNRETECTNFKNDAKDDSEIFLEQFSSEPFDHLKNAHTTNNVTPLGRPEISRIPIGIQREVAISPDVMYIDSDNIRKKDLIHNAMPKKSCLKKTPSPHINAGSASSASKSYNPPNNASSSKNNSIETSSKFTPKTPAIKKSNFKAIAKKSEELNALEKNKKPNKIPIPVYKSSIKLKPPQTEENELKGKQKSTIKVSNNENTKLGNKGSTTTSKQGPEKNVKKYPELKTYNKGTTHPIKEHNAKSIQSIEENCKKCENCSRSVDGHELTESNPPEREYQPLENETEQKFSMEQKDDEVTHSDKKSSMVSTTREISKLNTNDSTTLHLENVCRHRDSCGNKEFTMPAVNLNEIMLPCHMLIKVVEEQGKRITDLANLMLTHMNNGSSPGTYNSCRKTLCNHDVQTDSDPKLCKASTPKCLNQHSLPHLNVSAVNNEHLSEAILQEKHVQAIKKTCTVATTSECCKIDDGDKNVETFSHVSSVRVEQIIQVTKDTKVGEVISSPQNPTNKLQAKQRQRLSPSISAECCNHCLSNSEGNEQHKNTKGHIKSKNIKENINPNVFDNINEQNHLHNGVHQREDKAGNFYENNQDHGHGNQKLSLPDATNEETNTHRRKRHSDSGRTIPKVIIPIKNASLSAEIEQDVVDPKKHPKLKHLVEPAKRKPVEKERRKKMNINKFSSERFSPSTKRYFEKYNISGHSPALCESSSEEDLGNILMKLAAS